MSLALPETLQSQPTSPSWTSSLSASLRELALLTRQMAVMYRAGVPILSAVKALAHQTEEPRLAFLLMGVLWSLKKGASLSQAMRCYPAAFPPVYLALIEEGEATGTLERALDKAARLLESEYHLRQRVKSAMLYPVFVICFGFISGGLCIRLMAPILLELFGTDPSGLPWPTRWLMGLARLLSSGWATAGAIAVLALLLFLVWRGLATEGGVVWRDGWLLRLPVFGRLTRQMVLCRVARTLAVSARSGVNITRVMEICAEVAGNRVYRGSILWARDALINGVPLDECFSRQGKLYPPAFCAMVAVGQESGNLDGMADRLAALFEMEAGESLEAVMALVQPVVISILGVAVGFVGLATFLPLYQSLL